MFVQASVMNYSAIALISGGIGDTFCTRLEIECLPYAELLLILSQCVWSLTLEVRTNRASRHLGNNKHTLLGMDKEHPCGVKCEVFSVKCAIFCVKCEVLSVKCAV